MSAAGESWCCLVVWWKGEVLPPLVSVCPTSRYDLHPESWGAANRRAHTMAIWRQPIIHTQTSGDNLRVCTWPTKRAFGLGFELGFELENPAVGTCNLAHNLLFFRWPLSFLWSNWKYVSFCMMQSWHWDTGLKSSQGTKNTKPHRLCQSYYCRILWCIFFSFIQTKGVGIYPH